MEQVYLRVKTHMFSIPHKKMIMIPIGHPSVRPDPGLTPPTDPLVRTWKISAMALSLVSPCLHFSPSRVPPALLPPSLSAVRGSIPARRLLPASAFISLVCLQCSSLPLSICGASEHPGAAAQCLGVASARVGHDVEARAALDTACNGFDDPSHGQTSVAGPS